MSAMKIFVAPSAGACPGVTKALKVVEAALRQCPDNIYCLHDIVHNRQAMGRLLRLGLQKVDSLGRLKSGDNLVINTHGAGPSLYHNALSKRINIIDTTCANVRRGQKLAGDLAKAGYRLMITGEPNHPEVKGIIEWCGQPPIVIKDINDLSPLDIKDNIKIALISQTTFPVNRFLAIARHLKNCHSSLRIDRTICPSAELRQKGVSEIANKVDTIWVIGSSHSANTQALLEMAQTYHPDSRLIEDITEINTDHLYGVNTLGITAGASTPDWVINTVLERIKDLSENHIRYTESIEKGSGL